MKYNKQIYLGYDASGRQVRKWFHADTKAELNEKILEYKMEMRKVSNPSDVTFADYSGHWFQTYKANRSQQTRYSSSSAVLSGQAGFSPPPSPLVPPPIISVCVWRWVI